MPKLSPAEELDSAIRAAARDADRKASSRQVAEELYASDAVLIEHVSREWILEKLTAVIAKHRLAERRANDPQMLLDASFGFKRLPRRLVYSGTWMARSKATIRELRKFRAQIWKVHHPALEETDKAIELMEKYAAGNPGITFGEVQELEAKLLPGRRS